jgi:tRNA (cytidine32/uridine32-2'-O)-methyltransferase
MPTQSIEIPVRIVLTETSHPGNIGASARAMKTMGLGDLVLAAPREFPSAAATARASGADDLLARATVVPSLTEAIADCTHVVGASARLRSLSWPTTDIRSCATELWARSAAGRVAVVFGPEQSGLTNEDLARCHALVHIPANPVYSSLNLAMAVQVVCYELLMAYPGGGAGRAAIAAQGREAPLATAAELEDFHAHLEQIMRRSGYLNPERPRQLKLRLRRIFNRAELDRNEVNILRGLLAAVDPDKVANRTG